MNKYLFIFFIVCFLLLQTFFMMGCSSKESSISNAKVGIAEIYQPHEHKTKRTLNGYYDKNKLTAAHRTLPNYCKVKVVNLTNGYKTEVEINDRDLSDDCIIKLSKKAADELKLILNKTHKVSVEFIIY